MAAVNEEWTLRPGRNDDSEALIALIAGVYQEIGDEADLDGFDSDLLDIEGAYREKGGEFVVLEEKGEIVGAHATRPIDVEAGIVTFRRLYMPPRMRGTGAGQLLMDWAMEWSRERDFRRVEFWSDTRFHRAHRFFERYGFVRGGIRHLEVGKLSFSEHFYAMDLSSATDPNS